MVLTWLIKGVFYKKFFIIYKNGWEFNLTYYQRNRDVILNSTKDYYKNDKERLREWARNKYRNLSEEEKIIKENTVRIDIEMSEEKKEKLKGYQKYYCEVKSLNIIMNKIVL